MAQTLGEPADRALEALVLELADAPARVADDVVMMVAARNHGLVACRSLTHLDALDEAHPVKGLERPVDARDPDLAAALAEAVGDLVRGNAATLPRQLLDDGAASAAAPVARLAERRQRELAPVLVRVRHCPRGYTCRENDYHSRSMRMRTILICSAAPLLIGAVTACGGDNGAGEGEGPRVVATTGILADITANVAGPDVPVEQLIPDGASPHDFQLSAEDRQGLEEADLVVANGAGLEAGIPLADVDTPTWELTANAGELLPSGEGTDPHVWMDPVRVAGALPSLAAALGEADQSGAAAFDERAGEYAKGLGALDREIGEALRSVPKSDRELVTSHDALGYFADRYGLEVIASAFSASGPEAEPSAEQLDEVLSAIEDNDVAAVFAGAEDDPETLELIANEAGIAVEDGLLVESLGEEGTYAEMLRTDADLVSGALGG